MSGTQGTNAGNNNSGGDGGSAGGAQSSSNAGGQQQQTVNNQQQQTTKTAPPPTSLDQLQQMNQNYSNSAMEIVERHFRADPFKAAGKSDQQGQQTQTGTEGQNTQQQQLGAPGQTTPSAAPGGGQQSEPGQQQGTQQAPTAGGAAATPEVTALQTQIQNLTQQLNQMQAGNNQQQRQAGGGQGNQQQTDPFAHNYQFSVDAGIVQGLVSDDANERTNAVSMMVNSLANSVHETIANQIKQALQSERQFASQAAAQHVQAFEIRQDLFNTYPQLNNPAFGAVIDQTMQQLAQQQNVRSWSPQFRDQVATSVANALGIQLNNSNQQQPNNGNGGQTQQDLFQQAGSGTPNNQQTAPHMMGANGGMRPNQTNQSIEQQMFDRMIAAGPVN